MNQKLIQNCCKNSICHFTAIDHSDDDDHLVDCHNVPAVSEDGVEVEPGAGQDAGGVVDAEHRLLQV